jgi:hypothetical protein
MPKPRNIDPTFWDDPDVARLTRDERLLIIGMITLLADDEGRMLADPGYIRKRVFGYDDDVTRSDVEAWRNAVVSKCRNVVLYTVSDQQYMAFIHWDRYQKMRYAIESKLPPPSEGSQETPNITNNFGNLPQFSENSPRVELSRVKDGLGRDAPADKPPPPPTPLRAVPKPSSTASLLPKDFEVDEDMRLWCKQKCPGLDVDEATEEWIDYCRAKGVRHVDWIAAWRNGMKKAAQWQAESKAKGGSNGNSREPRNFRAEVVERAIRARVIAANGINQGTDSPLGLGAGTDPV